MVLRLALPLSKSVVSLKTHIVRELIRPDSRFTTKNKHFSHWVKCAYPRKDFIVGFVTRASEIAVKTDEKRSPACGDEVDLALNGPNSPHILNRFCVSSSFLMFRQIQQRSLGWFDEYLWRKRHLPREIRNRVYFRKDDASHERR